MREKILIYLICTLLIFSTTSLALTPFSINKQQKKQDFFDTTPVPLPLFKQCNRTFGGVWSDKGFSVQQTKDRGYIIIGDTRSFGAGSYDVWLIKTNANGDEMWNRTFGGIYRDLGSMVQQTTDGGYIIIGRFDSCSYECPDVWLIKTDSNGNELWNRTFEIQDWGSGKACQQTTDGGYIITRLTGSYGNYSDVLLIKTDANGNEEWNRTFGGWKGDGGYSVQQTIDGGYIITGFTNETGIGSKDIWLIKTDANGNEQWNMIFGGSDDDWSHSVQQTKDRGYIIIGDTRSFGAGAGIYYNVWLIKTDVNGNEIWNRVFGGIKEDGGHSVQQTIDGGYIITGYTISFGTHGDVWLIKTDREGKSKTISSGDLWFEKLVQCFPFMVKILNQLV